MVSGVLVLQAETGFQVLWLFLVAVGSVFVGVHLDATDAAVARAAERDGRRRR